MSDTSQGPGWWLASDNKWYPPQIPSPPLAEGVTPPTQTTTVTLQSLGATWQSPVAPQMPYGHAVSRPVGPIGKDRSPASVLGLSIITLGIYYIVWYHHINKEIKIHDSDIKVSAGWATFALFIPIANIVGAYSTAARIRQMQLDDGVTQTISPVVALLLFLFLGIGYPLYLASQMREHWHGHRRTGALA